MDIQNTIEKVDKAWRKSQAELDLGLQWPYKIDEVALVFSTSEALDRFLTEAMKAGAERFNSVERDVMDREDDSTAFVVRFEFLRLPEREFRIEAMTVLDGQAPLHEQYLIDHGDGSVVHTSFKVRDEYTYNSFQEKHGVVASYRNTYGRFCYMGGGEHPYLKPRVNLRDPIREQFPEDDSR